MSNRRQTTGGAARWSPKPLNRCCFFLPLKEGVGTIAFLGFLNGAFLIGFAFIGMHDTLADPCLEQPNGLRCKDPTPADVSVEGQPNSLETHMMLFTGMFQLVSSAVGYYASGKEHVASALFYLSSQFVAILWSLYYIVFGVTDPSVGIRVVQLLSLAQTVYFTMVAWSFYRQLKDRNQASEFDGEVAMEELYRRLE